MHIRKLLNAKTYMMELGRKLRLWALCLFLLHNIMEAGKLRLLSLFANIWSITRFVCRIYSGRESRHVFEVPDCMIQRILAKW